MAPLFSPRSARIVRRAIGAAILAVVLIPVGLMIWVRTPLVTGEGRSAPQPIAFDHRIHVRGLRVDCRYCHSTAEYAPTAGIPSTETCLPCHNQAWLEGPQFATVRASIATGRPIPWVRVNALPDFVFFNHAVHLKSGVGCESCHGRVDRMAVVSQAAPLTMHWCLQCHTHPDARRRPADAVAVMGWRPTSGAARPPPISQARIKEITSCSACHR